MALVRQARAEHTERYTAEVNGSIRSLVVKRLAPDIAQRTRLVVQRWLPAVGLSHSAPLLLDTVAERHGQCVWHIYEDLGDWVLDTSEPDPKRVAAAADLVRSDRPSSPGSAADSACQFSRPRPSPGRVARVKGGSEWPLLSSRRTAS
jgi:hypothetical protein